MRPIALTLAAAGALAGLAACVKTVRRLTPVEIINAANANARTSEPQDTLGTPGATTPGQARAKGQSPPLLIRSGPFRVQITPAGRLPFDQQHLPLPGPSRSPHAPDSASDSGLWAAQLSDADHAAWGPPSPTDFLPPPGLAAPPPRPTATIGVQVFATSDAGQPTPLAQLVPSQLGRSFTQPGVLVEQWGPTETPGTSLKTNPDASLDPPPTPSAPPRWPAHRVGVLPVDPAQPVRWLLPPHAERAPSASEQVAYAGTLMLRDGRLVTTARPVAPVVFDAERNEDPEAQQRAQPGAEPEVQQPFAPPADRLELHTPGSPPQVYRPAQASARLSWPVASPNQKFVAVFQWDPPIVDLAPQDRPAGSGRWLIFSVGTLEPRASGQAAIPVARGPEMSVPPGEANASAVLGTPPPLASTPASKAPANSPLQSPHAQHASFESLMLVPAPAGDVTALHALWPDGTQCPLPDGVAAAIITTAMVESDDARVTRAEPILLALQGQRLRAATLRGNALRNNTIIRFTTLSDRSLVPRGGATLEGTDTIWLIGPDRTPHQTRLERLEWLGEAPK